MTQFSLTKKAAPMDRSRPSACQNAGWPPRPRLRDKLNRAKNRFILLKLVGGDIVSVDDQWRFLGALYDFKPIISTTLAILLACLSQWNKGFSGETKFWILSAFFIFVARFALSRAYASRSPSGLAQTWMARYFVAATITGFQWGLGGLLLVNAKDGIAASAVFAVVAALVSGAASRGYMFPAAALVQINLTTLIVALFSLFAGKFLFFVMMILFGIHQTLFLRSLVKLKLKEINSENQRIMLLLTLENTNEQLAAANARLQTIARTDALTGIANRRSFDVELATRWTEARQTATPLSLLFIDIDHFKRFNDMYGHQAGDRCLTLVAAAIKSVARNASDHAARYGGEEFALILPDSDLGAAKMVAERLGSAVRSIAVNISESQCVSVSVSAGIGSLIPYGTLDESVLISAADQALYRAKQEGRDCVRWSEPARADIVPG